MDIPLTRIAGSSSVAGKGYHPTTETMRIDYHGTGTYDYYNISKDDYNRLEAAESIGKELRSIIKGKRFRRVL